MPLAHHARARAHTHKLPFPLPNGPGIAADIAVSANGDTAASHRPILDKPCGHDRSRLFFPATLSIVGKNREGWTDGVQPVLYAPPSPIGVSVSRCRRPELPFPTALIHLILSER